jgi:hypothetical protein
LRRRQTQQWISVISASSHAICCPPLRAELAAGLDLVHVVRRARGMPMILAFEAWACRMNDDRSGVANGGRTEPSLAAQR